MKVFLFFSTIIIMVIVKEKSYYILYSKDKKKRLGKFKTKKEALKRERQIQFFKHMKGKG